MVRSTITNSYVMNADDSGCDIYTCTVAASSLVAIATSSTSTSGAGHRLYAPIRATRASLGFCSRDVSCSSHGEATSSRSAYVTTCDTTTAGADCVAALSIWTHGARNAKASFYRAGS